MLWWSHARFIGPPWTLEEINYLWLQAFAIQADFPGNLGMPAWEEALSNQQLWRCWCEELRHSLGLHRLQTQGTDALMQIPTESQNSPVPASGPPSASKDGFGYCQELVYGHFSLPWGQHVWTIPLCSASTPSSLSHCSTPKHFPHHPHGQPKSQHSAGISPAKRTTLPGGWFVTEERWRKFWRTVQFGKGKAALVTLVAKPLASVLVLLVDCSCYCLSSMGKGFE